MPRDVARDDGRAGTRGFEGRDLAIQGADLHAFFIAEHGRVDRAGDVVVGVFERRAHIDDLVEFIQLV
ncbi:hypothetical protein D3C72_2095530 [compost metagenome]